MNLQKLYEIRSAEKKSGVVFLGVRFRSIGLQTPLLIVGGG
jgi:hypothetical protein